MIERKLHHLDLDTVNRNFPLRQAFCHLSIATLFLLSALLHIQVVPGPLAFVMAFEVGCVGLASNLGKCIL